MVNYTAVALRFCGRASELETIKARWRLARNEENPCPQVVVIKAERGLGKTRLALEFYKWLRENEDGYLTKTYWPDAVEMVDRNIELNPDPNRCNLFDVPIPYLWWGLRAADIGAENGVAADGIATYDRFLAPHLKTLLLKSEMVHYGISLAKVLGKLGIELGTSALGIGDLIAVGKGILHTAEIIFGAADKRELTEALERPLSRSNSVLADLGSEFKPSSITYAKVPGVVFIDDAQFIHKDPALPIFIETLMRRSVVERWPLLVLITHWRAELAPELAESGICFSKILKHAREGSANDTGPAAGLPGGYLRDDHFAEIDLKPIPDLSDALGEKLPGLTAEQSAAILAETGGNPRFLEQVILFLLEHIGLFEGFDPTRSLTPDGFKEAFDEMRHSDIVKIVLRRLQKAPVEVQEAICLASVQGMRFANDFVDQMAQDVLGHPVREPLRRGEDPYSMLIGTKAESDQQIGEFAERVFYQAAQEHRRSLISLVGEQPLEVSLRKSVAKVVLESDPKRADHPEAIGLVCGIALSCFETSSKSMDRFIAQRAVSFMAYIELLRGSFESAAALYERLLEIKPTEPEAGYEELEHFVRQYQQRIEILDRLAAIYRNLNWPARSAKALRRILGEATSYLEIPHEFFAVRDKEKAKEVFERWQRDHPRTPGFLYTWAVEKVVSAYLDMSELVRAGYHPKVADGDEPLAADSFFIVLYEVNDGTVDPQKPVEEPAETAELLATLAYAQNGVLGQGAGEKQHVWMLERLGRLAIDRREYKIAEEYLQRALKITESLPDEMFRLSTINNLIVAFGQRGDLERSLKYLEMAAPICNSYMSESTFAVDVIMEKSGPDGSPAVVGHRRVEAQDKPQQDQSEADDSNTGSSRWIRRVHIPVKFSREFDANPEEVIRRDRTMMGVIASVFGNAGHWALKRDDVSKAKSHFQNALSIHEDVGDPEGAFQDLERLTHIAYRTGERQEVCMRLRNCLGLAPALLQVDAQRWKNIELETRDAMRQAGCTDDAVSSTN
jgi:tetratricopeptide (TPR) repeat protein